MTWRKLVTGLATAATAAAQDRQRPVEWKPRLGILGPFTEANVRFAKEEGFTNMILGAGRRSTMDPTALDDQYRKREADPGPIQHARVGLSG